MQPKPENSTNEHASASVGRRMADGAVWLIGLRMATRLLGLISLLIVARLLLPEDYALIALATTIAALLEVAGDFGAELMVIREQNADRHDYDTAFTITLIKGVIDAVLLCALAKPIALWFGDVRLENIIYCCAAASLVFSARNIGVVDFRKNLEINKEFAFQITGKLAQFFTAVILAYLWQSYWALMAAILVHRVVMLATSYILSSYRPRLSLRYWRKYFNFSKWIAINNLLMFGRDRLDTLIVGKMTTPTTLGHYQLAHEIANLPTTDLVGPVTRALFPGYAMIADDRDRLAPSFVDSLAALMLVALPFGFGLSLIGEPLVALFFNENWQAAAPLITALAVFGVIRACYANSGVLFLALGRVRIEPMLMAVYIAIAVPLMILLIPPFGPMGAAYALIIAASLNLILNYVVVCRLLAMPLMDLWRKVWRILAASAVMCLVIFLIMPLADAPLAQIGLAFAAGAISYLGCIWLLWGLSGAPDGPERHTLDYLANLARLIRQWRPPAGHSL